ncbi:MULTISPECIES: hypothetical protein [Actinoplanes]|uniref:hypothetical protein n=1 Tax=Actinoplanes TaxID=1865 RepID=UPI0012FBC6DF|nr:MULTISPECIES: hypothetical protein [Actinoplanes]
MGGRRFSFHHFAHDAAGGRLHLKGVQAVIASFARDSLPTLRSVFPTCHLDGPAELTRR